MRASTAVRLATPVASGSTPLARRLGRSTPHVRIPVDGLGDCAAVEKSDSRNSSDTGDRRLKSNARLRSTRPPRNSSRRRVIHLLRRPAPPAAKRRQRSRLARRHRPARRAIQRSQQQHAAFQALASPIEETVTSTKVPAARTRQAGGHKHAATFLTIAVAGESARPCVHDVGQGLSREYGLLAVSGLGEPTTMRSRSGSFPAPFDARQIADLTAAGSLARQRSEGKQPLRKARTRGNRRPKRLS